MAEPLRARAWLPVIAAAVVALLVGLAVMDTLPVGVFFDDGMYVILAKSLATGHGMRWLQLPGMPPATHYPPGYPFVLSLLWRMYPSFPENVVLFTAANACFLAIAAGGVAVFAQRRLGFSPWFATAFAVAATVGLPTLVLSARVMSEPLFLALLIPVLLFAERVIDAKKPAAPVASVVALGVLVGLVTLVRTNGIAVAGGVLIVLALRQRVRDACIFGATTVAVLIPWQLWVHANGYAVPAAVGGSYESYATWLANGFREVGPGLLPRTVAQTSRELGAMLSLMSAPSMPHAAQLTALAVALLLAVIGARRIWRDAPVSAAFLGCYLLIVLLWPFTPARFLWAVWPFVVLMPLLGVLELVAWHPRANAMQVVRWAPVACACLLALGYARYTERAYRGRWWSSAARQTARIARPLVQWVVANTPDTAVISSEIEPMMYLYAHRLAVPASRFTVRDYFRPPTVAESADALRGILRAYPVSDIAVAPHDSLRASLYAMSTGASPELTLRDTVPNGLVFVPSPR